MKYSFRNTAVVVLLLLLMAVDQTKAITVGQFRDATEVIAVKTEEDGVTLAKVGEGDAFVRWGVDKEGFVPIDAAHDRLTIDFGKFDKARIQVRVEFAGHGEGSRGAADWLKGHSAAGPVTLESVADLAKAASAPNANRYRLFMRIQSGEGAKIQISDIVFGQHKPARDEEQPVQGEAAGGDRLTAEDFSDTTEFMQIGAAKPGLYLDKIGEGDARTTWMPGGKMIPLDDAHDQLVIDFGDFERSQVQVLLYFTGTGENATGHKTWLSRHAQSGLARLESVRAYAKQQGLANAQQYRLMFRIQSGAGARVQVRDMRVLPAGAALPDALPDRPDGLKAAETEKMQAQQKPEVVLTPLDRLTLSVNADTPIHVLDAKSTTPPVVVFSNPNDESMAVSVKLTFRDYDDQRFSLERELQVPGKGQATWPLSREQFAQGYWYVDYDLTSNGQTRRGQTRLAATVIPGVGKFDPAGYNYGICWNEDPLSEKWPAAMATFGVSGADHCRMHWKWEAAESKQGHWNFDFMDRFVKGTQDAGIEVLHILAYNTFWAVPEDIRRRRDWRFYPPDLDLWQQYVRQMVERYPTIRNWEVWNEPDLVHFWLGDTQQYIDLLKVTHQTIKSIDPDATVTTAGFALLAPHGGRKHVNLQRDVVIEGRPYYDIWATHMHGTSAGFISQIDGPMADIRQDLVDQGISEAPIWFTETAIQAGQGEWNQAEEMIRKMVYARVIGAMGYTWFMDRDYLRSNGTSTTWGLLDAAGQAKPGLIAFNTMTRYLGDRELERRLDLGDGNYGFLFGPAEQGASDRLLITWSAGTEATRGVRTVQVRPETIATAIDAMGRTHAIEVVDHRIALPVDSRPTLVLLEHADDTVLVEPAMLEVPGPIVVYPGGSATVKVKMNNPYSDPRAFAILYDSHGAQSAFEAMLEAGQEQKTDFEMAMDRDARMRFGDIRERVIHYRLAGRWEGELRIPMVIGSLIPAGTLEREPDFTLDSNHHDQIINLYSFDPGSNHLVWHGPDDLSAKVWLQRTDDAVRVVVEVRDDIHQTVEPVEQAWQGDSVQVALAVPHRDGRWQLTVSKPEHADAAQTFVRRAPKGLDRATLIPQATVTRVAEDRLKYEVRLPLAQLGLAASDLRSGIRFNLVVNDRDHDVREGWAQIAPGIANNADEQRFPVVKFE